MIDDKLLQRQLDIEQEANNYSYDRLTREIAKRVDQGQADELKEGQLILIHSIEAVTAKIKSLFNTQHSGATGTAIKYLACEFGERPRDLAYMLLAIIVRSISKEVYVKSTKLITDIIKQIQHSVLLYDLEKNCPNFNSYIEKKYSHRRRSEIEKYKKEASLTRERHSSTTELTKETTLMGSILLEVVVKSGCNIIEIKNVRQGKKTFNHVIYTKECFRMVLQSREQLLMDYRKFPIFVIQPTDWSAFDGSGGYYHKDIYKVPLIKTRNTKKILRKYFENNKVSNLYTILNTLQRTAWTVNRRVFDVMNKVYQDNIIDDSSATNNPYLIGNLPYNGYLEASDFINPNSFGKLATEGKYKGLPEDKVKMKQYFDAFTAQEKILATSNGKTIMTSLVLHNAREYLNEEEIYFSYQYDFRGRIYPIQQHLQPQGSGEIKALLQFAKGYPIENEEELRWFLIHGANCYGFDKDEYEDRVKKIKEKHQEILKVAENPLRYRHFWKDSDEPYLYLAWCFEYADYVKLGSSFRSHIPIALDATCSGIQIYSGLLKDRDGAEAVNVIGNTRNDIYQRVADKVNGYLLSGDYPKELTYTTADKEKHSISTVAMADSLKGKITRKIVKRNTMTQPYSVTKFGMYEQLKDELYTMEHNGGKFWIGDTWLVAKLLTELNDRAIAETVKGARIGQEYLKEVTKDLVKGGNYIAYKTPILKFPVVQKIHRTKVDRVTTPIGKLHIRKTTPDLHEQKMVNGIAPNYIHSLDALLLSITILKLLQDGCNDFHLIHDSYGVPITQVCNLNKRVREAYIEIFKANPLEQWLLQVHKDYDKVVTEVMINTLNLDKVKDSSYIFS